MASLGKVLDGEQLPAGPATIASTAGIVGVMRYVAPAAWNWPKALTAGELASIEAAHLPVAFNYETDGKSWRGGYNQGHIDGTNCNIAMSDLGLAGRSVYYSPADENVNAGGFQSLADCIHGFNDARGLITDAYLTKAEADYCRARNLVNRTWQINARGWYGNGPDDLSAALIQHTTHSFPFPPSLYDESDCYATDWGQYPAADPPPEEVDPVPFLHHIENDPAYHAVYINNGINYRWLVSQTELDTWCFLLKQDPAKIGTLTKAQIGGTVFVGSPAH